MPLTLTEANRVIDAAFAKARQLETTICVSVYDADGHLVTYQRINGIFAEASFELSWKGNWRSNCVRSASYEFGLVPHHTSTDAVSGELVPMIEGLEGLPIRSGKIEGGIGVSGVSDDEQSADCARAGAKALEMETSSMPPRG